MTPRPKHFVVSFKVYLPMYTHSIGFYLHCFFPHFKAQNILSVTGYLQKFILKSDGMFVTFHPLVVVTYHS